MLMKYCPACGKYSFSTSDAGIWVCPTCSEDLTSVVAEIATVPG